MIKVYFCDVEYNNVYGNKCNFENFIEMEGFDNVKIYINSNNYETISEVIILIVTHAKATDPTPTFDIKLTLPYALSIFEEKKFPIHVYATNNVSSLAKFVPLCENTAFIDTNLSGFDITVL